jgi:hypothetical protein
VASQAYFFGFSTIGKTIASVTAVTARNTGRPIVNHLEGIFLFK